MEEDDIWALSIYLSECKRAGLPIFCFAYGENLNIEKFKKICPKAIKIGTTYLEGYKLIFDETLTFIKTFNKKDKIPIGVWQITFWDEINLDRYLIPKYCKNDINLEVLGEMANGIIYYKPKRKSKKWHARRPIYEKGIIPTKEYLKIVEKGYEDFGLDKKYLYEALERVKKENEE